MDLPRWCGNTRWIAEGSIEVLWLDDAVTRLEDLPVDEVVVVQGGGN